MGMSYSSGFNLEKLQQSLFARQGRFYKDMRVAAEAGAEIIMKKSQSNAPVDTHNLEEAHHIEESTTRADNVKFKVVVSGEGHGSDDPRDVSGYALEIHEHYENYHMGPKSLAKLDAGHDVGGKYLERALEDKKDEAVELIRQASRKNWK